MATRGRTHGQVWSHNDFYAPWVARQVRESGAQCVVDVGSGIGFLLSLLRESVPRVVGLEPDSATAQFAIARFSVDDRVSVVNGTFELSLGDETWDAITFVASWHHMALADTLRLARTRLNPGGRLVIVGLSRETVRDLPSSLGSVVLNPIVGLLWQLNRSLARGEIEIHPTAPINAPGETLSEIRAVAHAILPGIRIRRRLFWRYTAVWDAPRFSPGPTTTG